MPVTEMQCEWLGERVATVDVTRAITNVLHKKEDAGWGPNAVFRFPLEGGTGGIWKKVAAQLPQDKLVRARPFPPVAKSYSLCARMDVQQAASDNNARYVAVHAGAQGDCRSSSRVAVL